MKVVRMKGSIIRRMLSHRQYICMVLISRQMASEIRPACVDISYFDPSSPVALIAWLGPSIVLPGYLKSRNDMYIPYIRYGSTKKYWSHNFGECSSKQAKWPFIILRVDRQEGGG